MKSEYQPKTIEQWYKKVIRLERNLRESKREKEKERKQERKQED